MSHPIAHLLKTVFLGLLLSLLIVACNQQSDAKNKPIPQLNDDNIDAFALSLGKDYFRTAASLTTSFKSHKQSGKSYQFTQFRNNTWTPAYIKEKKFYQSVYQQNKIYINSSKRKPLFLAYENLIYIGVDLKNALLNKNNLLEKEAMASLRQDKASIKAILKLKNNKG